MKTGLATVSFEIAQVSREHVLGVMFPKSRANAYPATVVICKGAARYWEAETEGLLYHFAMFDRSPEQMARALAVVNYANTMTAARFFAKGMPLVDTFELYNSLKCFVQSLSCADPRAHCLKVVTNPADKLDYLFPCKRLVERSPSFPLDRAHPSHVHDQIQAKAVEMGCDWCPNFDPTLFKQLPIPENRLTYQKPNIIEWGSGDSEIDVTGGA